MITDDKQFETLGVSAAPIERTGPTARHRSAGSEPFAHDIGSTT